MVQVLREARQGQLLVRLPTANYVPFSIYRCAVCCHKRTSLAQQAPLSFSLPAAALLSLGPCLPCAPRKQLTRLAAASDNNTDKGAANSAPPTPSSPPPPADEGDDSPDEGPRKGAPRRSSSDRRWSWLPKLQLQSPLRFVLNTLGILLLMRLFPIPGTQNVLGNPEAVILRVSFSEFVKNARRNDVARVVVDGNRLTFTLRPSSEVLKSVPKEVDRSKFAFETVRPGDYSTPYEKLIENGVQVSAVDRRGGGIGSLFVRASRLG